MGNYRSAIDAFENIDISGIADGTYIGECDVDFISKAVENALKQ